MTREVCDWFQTLLQCNSWTFLWKTSTQTNLYTQSAQFERISQILHPSYEIYLIGNTNINFHIHRPIHLCTLINLNQKRFLPGIPLSVYNVQIPFLCFQIISHDKTLADYLNLHSTEKFRLPHLHFSHIYTSTN